LLGVETWANSDGIARGGRIERGVDGVELEVRASRARCADAFDWGYQLSWPTVSVAAGDRVEAAIARIAAEMKGEMLFLEFMIVFP
jgi:hypothetical protein